MDHGTQAVQLFAGGQYGTLVFVPVPKPTAKQPQRRRSKGVAFNKDSGRSTAALQDMIHRDYTVLCVCQLPIIILHRCGYLDYSSATEYVAPTNAKTQKRDRQKKIDEMSTTRREDTKAASITVRKNVQKYHIVDLQHRQKTK